jgi:hypothetical protein
VTEALACVKKEIQAAVQQAKKVVRFNVGTLLSSWHSLLLSTFLRWFPLASGKGLHSVAGKAKIRPALEAFCAEYVKGLGIVTLTYVFILVDIRYGYKPSADPRNAGVLIVQCSR